MMQNKTNEKGITLLILVIAIIILTLITVPIAVNTTEVSQLQKYTYFKSDIDSLRESIETAYLGVSNISTIGPEYTGNKDFLTLQQNGQDVKNPNDSDTYYVIDLKKLNSYIEAQVEIVYGEGNRNNKTDDVDTYIINSQSRTIYYVKGMKYKDQVYYRLPEPFTSLSDTYVATYDLNGGTGEASMETTTGVGTITLKSAPTRSGYTFSGWKEEGTSDIYSAGASYTLNKSTKFIAQWE